MKLNTQHSIFILHLLHLLDPRQSVGMVHSILPVYDDCGEPLLEPLYVGSMSAAIYVSCSLWRRATAEAGFFAFRRISHTVIVILRKVEFEIAEWIQSCIGWGEFAFLPSLVGTKGRYVGNDLVLKKWRDIRWPAACLEFLSISEISELPHHSPCIWHFENSSASALLCNPRCSEKVLCPFL